MMKFNFIEENIENIENLYNSFLIPNFLEDELKPLEIIMNLYQKNRYKVLSIKEDDLFLGVAFIVFSKDFNAALLDYFVIDEKYRSQGIGSRFLSYISNIYANSIPLIIETEYTDETDCCSDSLKIRRESFYDKNCAYKISYTALIWNCHYNIWYLSNSRFSDEEILSLYDSIYRFMLPKSIFDLNCIIPKK